MRHIATFFYLHRHPFLAKVSDSPENLMIQGTDTMKITPAQGATMIKNAEEQPEGNDEK